MPFTTTENKEFRDMVSYLRPSMHGKVIGADALKTHIMEYSQIMKERLKAVLRVSDHILLQWISD